MDCEACNDLLIDYLYDELDEVRRAAMRKHLEGCSTCNDSCERLSRGRHAARSLAPIEAPPPSGALLQAIQAAAAANAEPRREGHGGSVAPVVPIDARARIPRWVRRVGEMAMRRQVAMAAVFPHDRFRAQLPPATGADAAGADERRAGRTGDPRDGTSCRLRPRPPVKVSRRRRDVPRPLAPLSWSERTSIARRPLPALQLGSVDELGRIGTCCRARSSPAAEAAVGGMDDQQGRQASARVGRGATSLDPPTAYREQQPPPAQTPGSLAIRN